MLNLLWFKQDLGKNNPAFQQTDDIVDAKGHHRRQRRPDYAVDEDSIPAGFSNVAFEEDDQQSVTPPPPYPAAVDSTTQVLKSFYKKENKNLKPPPYN